MTFCAICGRVGLDESEYCRYHQQALENLRVSFGIWRESSGVSWEEYIERLSQIDETGRWVLEVVEQIKSEDGFSKLS